MANRSVGTLRAHLATVVVVVIGAVIVAIPITWVATSSSSPRNDRSPQVGNAVHRVVNALSATVDSGSYNFTSVEDPVVPAPTTTTTACPAAGVDAVPPGKFVCGSAPVGLSITAQGTVDTHPFAMVADSNVPGIGPTTLRDDGNDVWEYGGGDYGLVPGSSDAGPGAPLSGFSSSVEGTLGPRQGALAMMGLASPTGYLTLEQNAISAANQIGTGTVDAAAVTVYKVTLDPAQEASVPGTTSEEATAITDALGVLKDQGYTGTTVTVSIDGAGFLRKTVSVASFADGATQSQEVTLSNFGCAGKVLMPGDSGSTAPPPGCVSPDDASSTTLTTG